MLGTEQWNANHQLLWDMALPSAMYTKMPIG